MTATALARRLTATLVAVINLAFVTACGGSDGGPTAPLVVTPPPQPVLTFFVVTVDSVITEGNASPVRFSCAFDGGASYDCTTEVQSWSAEGSLEKRGTTVVGMTPGVGRVSASFKGKIAEVSVRVKPDGTPWAQLPAISNAGKARLANNLGSSGRLARWDDADLPLKVWVDSALSASDVEAASGLWSQATAGKISFVVVSDPNAAKVRVVFDSTITDTLSCASYSHSVSAYRITSLVVRIATRQACVGSATYRAMLVAHEIGHGMGLWYHSAPNTDIMSSPSMKWMVSSLDSEVLVWIYSVPIGTKPI